ncbi:MAG TPA: SDR family oxidoreductase, partial [Miltoncostaeaceae bacterium]|nr:SDR family oxidoreductase [Miltoncostaeaceae bacterium]
QVAAEAEAGLGGVDVLVNSAANFVSGPVLEIPPERVRAAFALNVEAPFHLAQALAPGMIARGWGRIVNINDVAGLEPWPRFEIHSVSKAALLMLTKALAQALAPAVLVNGIAPGTVLMPKDAPPGATDRSAAKTVLGRVGSPQDVADALRYLLSADYVTGHTLVVDGGRMVRA